MMNHFPFIELDNKKIVINKQIVIECFLFSLDRLLVSLMDHKLWLVTSYSMCNKFLKQPSMLYGLNYKLLSIQH